MLGLLRRQLAAHWGVPVALAVLVLLLSAVATAWPRALAGIDDRQLAYEFDAASVIRRDVVAVSQAWPRNLPPEPGSTDLPPGAEEAHGGLVLALEEFRVSLPEPLRSALGEARFHGRSQPYQVVMPSGSAVGTAEVFFKSDPYLTEHVDLVEGEWPAPYEAFPSEFQVDGESLTEAEVEELYREWEEGRGADESVEVAMSAPAARALEWEIGEERYIASGEGRFHLVLTGLFEAQDLDEEYWLHNPSSAEIEVVEDLNLGTLASTAVYLDPGWDGELPQSLVVSTTRQPWSYVWFPVSGESLRGSDVAVLSGQLTAMAGQTVTIGYGQPELVEEDPTWAEPVDVGFGTELAGVIDRLAEQQRIAATVLAVVVAGPVGVVVAVLVLGARLVIARRAPSLALLSARGASGGQLRGAAALEGLLLGAPAAALGALIARGVVDGPGRTSDVVIPAVIAVVLALALGAVATPGGLRPVRQDLTRGSGRARWVAEIAIVGIALTAVVALFQRGVNADEEGIDLLAVAAPVLVTFAVCVLVLRLYPVPLRAVVARLRRGRGLVGFLGAARGQREPAGGLVPTTALVVGVSVAVFSVVLLTTVTAGVRTAAWSAVGADLRLSGPIFDSEKVEALRDVEGVAHVATVYSGDAMAVRIAGEGMRAQLVAVDAAELYEIHGLAPEVPTLPEGLRASEEAPLPAVVSSDIAFQAGAEGDELVFPGAPVPITVVGEVAELVGVPTSTSFVIVDRASLGTVRESEIRPRVALIALADGADPDEVLERIREVEPVALAQNPLGSQESFLASPLASGMNTALASIALLGALLVAVAIVLTQLIAAPQRQRLLAVLRTLGLSRAQARGLVSWELAPVVGTALLAGGVLGLVLPRLVLGSLDLRALTGGERQPELVLDPVVLGAVFGGVILLVAVVVWVSTIVSVRADTASALRVGEER